MSERIDLGVLGISVPAGTHLCVFCRGSAGVEEIVFPFLAEGIRARDKCICILESRMPSDVLDRLGRQIDVGSSVVAGQLELGTPADAYLRTGRFSTQEMLDYWSAAGAAAQTGAGFSFVRATGEMPSVLDNPAGRAEFFRYEAMLNDVVPKYPQVILCLYDLERWGAEVLMDTLRTHRLVIVDGMVHDNPYYIDPGTYLAGRN
jgi:hypothetical protein